MVEMMKITVRALKTLVEGIVNEAGTSWRTAKQVEADIEGVERRGGGHAQG
jgi:hypothetical protein